MVLIVTQIDNTVIGLDIFRVLGNGNRRNMLKLLLNREMHVSAIARELNISVPVALRHARFLEEAGFIERKKVGTSHVLGVKKESMERLKQMWELLEQPLIVEIEHGKTMLEALKKVPGIKIGSSKEGCFISGVDGKKGYFIYEVNGKLVENPLEKLTIEKDSTVELKRLIPVIGKKIQIRLKR